MKHLLTNPEDCPLFALRAVEEEPINNRIASHLPHFYLRRVFLLEEHEVMDATIIIASPSSPPRLARLSPRSSRPSSSSSVRLVSNGTRRSPSIFGISDLDSGLKSPPSRLRHLRVRSLSVAGWSPAVTLLPFFRLLVRGLRNVDGCSCFWRFSMVVELRRLMSRTFSVVGFP